MSTTFTSRASPMLTWTLGTRGAQEVSAVRHQVMAVLRGRSSGTGDLDSAELVVAELLNNALAHTPGPAWVALSWEGVHPLLSVTDAGDGFGHRPELLDEHDRLVPRLPDDTLSERGRGLFLVAQLTHDLVVTARPTGGSVVSVTLRLRHRDHRRVPVRRPGSPDGTGSGGVPSARSPEP